MATNKKTAKKKTAKKTAAPKKVTKISAAKRTKSVKATGSKKAKSSAAKSSKQKKSSASSGKVISLSHHRENRATKSTGSAKVDWSSYLTPIDDRVLVELGETYERTPGGLFIPDSAQSRPNSGKVVAVGPGKRDKKGRRKPLDVQVGEKIMYVDYAGSKLKLEGRDLLLVNESDILGVIET